MPDGINTTVICVRFDVIVHKLNADQTIRGMMIITDTHLYIDGSSQS